MSGVHKQLLVNWARRIFSEENESSKSKSSSEGGGISQKEGGNTCTDGLTNKTDVGKQQAAVAARGSQRWGESAAAARGAY
jgi:hypothetical protein